MKKLIILGIAISIGMNLSSCVRVPKQEEKVATSVSKIDSNKIGKPIIEEKYIMANFNTFWSYYTTNIKFFEDFLAFDTAGKVITKEQFLETLTSAKYYPLMVYSKDSLINYKLAKIPSTGPQDAGAYLRQDSKSALVHYKMEAKPIPAFDFVDVNGEHYSSENTKGKIVLFKCWFINCGACIKEMPELNKMVQKYRDRGDVLFISLASDLKKPLQEFLKKTKFDYATVPNQENYMQKQLKVPSYPYHFLINKQGLLVKSVSEAADIEVLLERELKK